MVRRMQTDSSFGWRIVAAAFLLGIFGWGVGFYGPPVFLHAVQEMRHWSTLLVSTAVTLHFLVGAAVVANLAALYRRFGLPAVTKAGAVALALGVLGWAAAREPWQLLLATFLSGAGWVAMGAAAVNAIVAPWFVAKRPAAIAMAYNGASIGGLVFSPLWVAAIGSLGFPAAASVIGLAMIATVWLLSDRFFSRRPDTAAAPATTTPRSAAILWRDGRFLSLAAAMALGLFAQIGLIAHLFSLLVPALGEQWAGLLMGAATGTAILGRSLVGWLMPPGSDRRLVACANHAVQIAGFLVLIAAGGNVVLLAVGVLLFGAGIGNTTSLPPLIAQAEFAREDAARAVPLIVAVAQGAYAFAPAAFGALRTVSAGEATLVFVVAAAIQVLAVVAFLAGRNRLLICTATPPFSASSRSTR